jgi:hypothetical protein
MRYIYIITRICKGMPNGVTAYPNLGVFPSLKKAQLHFVSIKADRVRRGYRIAWDIPASETTFQAPHVAIRRALFLSGLGDLVRNLKEESEELILERWPINAV